MSVKCTWTYDGKTFLDERHLDNYLVNNNLSEIEVQSDIIFERASRNQKVIKVVEVAGEEARRRLDDKRATAIEAMEKREINRVEDIEKKYPSDFYAESYSDDYQPVSEYVYNAGELDRLNIDNYVEKRKIELKTPNAKDSAKLTEIIANNKNLITDEEIFTKLIEEEILQWNYIRKTGKALDKIFGIVINQKFQYDLHYKDGSDGKDRFNVQKFIDDNAKLRDSSGKSWYDLEGLYQEELQSDGTMKKVSPLLDSFVTQIKDLKRNQLNITSQDHVFYQYVVDHATSNDGNYGIRGKIDILVVRSDGSIDIYDIKTSGRDYADWDRDKHAASRYQLGFYKRMVENLGVNPGRITLNVIPIHLADATNKTLGAIELRNPVTIFPESAENKFIDATLPVQLQSYPESDELRNKIKETLNKMLPTVQLNNQILNVNDDYFFDSNRIRKEGSKFVFSDLDEGIKVYADTKDEILQKYKNYYAGRIESNSWFNNIKSSLNKSLRDFDEGKDGYANLFSGTKIPTNIKLEFRKYFVEEGWVEAQMPKEIQTILDELNIILLENRGVYDIIGLTSFELDRVLKLKFGKTIFGNFKSDINSGKNPRMSSIGNILLMRNMVVANILSKALEKQDLRFRDISILNTSRDSKTSLGRMYTLPAYRLIDDAKRLHNFSGNSFSLNNNNVSSVDDNIKQLFLAVKQTSGLSSKSLPDTYSKNRKMYDELRSFGNELRVVTDGNTVSEIEIRSQKLHDLWKLINKVYNRSEISIDQLTQAPTMEGYIYRETAKLMALNNNTYMDAYNSEQLPKYGYENIFSSFGQRNTLNGTMTMTIDTIPIVETIHNSIQIVNNRIRKTMEMYKVNENRRMFASVGMDKNISMMNMKRFYDQSDEGKRLFLFKNPETDSSLDNKERTFLSWYLKKMNELIYSENNKPLTDEKINALKNDAERSYYKVPLLRRSAYSRATNSNFAKTALKPSSWYKESINTFYNLRNAVEGKEELFNEDSDYRDMISMYNIFNSSDSERASLIAKAEGDLFNMFEAHLEIIMDTFVQSKAMSDEYDRVLPAISAAVASLNAIGYSSGVDVKESYDFINNYIKSSIFNESLLPKNQMVKAITFLKGKVSAAILGYNPLSGGKEVLNGIYYHYTRAIAYKVAGDKDKVGIADMMRAYSTVWVDAIKQIGTITKLEKMNTRFGISNMDINSLVDNFSYFKRDPLRFKYTLFWMNRAPDFLNRMTILVGYLYKWGTYDAYSVDDDTGLLKYDWKKDKRFNLLANDDRSNNTEYLNQKALYSKMMEDLVEQGYQYEDKTTGMLRNLVWDPNDFYSKNNDDLQEGLTLKQIKAIKQESDRAFGYMDHDTKSMIFKAGITAIFFQFKTFATAKMHQWLIKPGIRDQGYYKHVKDEVTGELLYRKVVKLTDGTYDTEIVNTQFITEDGEKIELDPYIQFVGSQMEGMLWSFLDLINIFQPQNLKEYWLAPEYSYKRANFLIALQEIGLLIFILWLFRTMFGEDNEVRNIDNFFERNALTILKNSSNDLNPIDTIFKGNVNLEFTAYDFITTFVGDVWGTLTGEPSSSMYRTLSRFGAMSTVRKNLNDLHRTEASERRQARKE